MTATRAAESSERGQDRREEDRAKHAASRAAEDSEDTRTRLDGQRTRQAASKAAEDPIQRRTRSEDQRRRQAASRATQWTFMEGEAFRDVRPYYNALKWHAETRGMCCSGGKVKLPELQLPPEPLKSLMPGTTPESQHFLDNIGKYNSCFQMTSFGMPAKVSDSGFMPTFRVQGQIYHRGGFLLPPSNEEHKFL
ncbi:unnamed protein product [Rotaria magnacalcarata]|uniref:Uncharacterized protein n=1 Tax=Rotaria magnacalcarata TaxID=392030 RepID=A0A819DE34_9BILA|nr:unnamed protein product [Rotaria magnacalcarata]